MADVTQHSKFLSLILRHKPGSVGLTLDDAGWVEVDALLKALDERGRGMSRDDLNQVVADNNKKRFEFNEDGTRIRARQGHSVEVELGYQPKAPPAVLYHGTAERFLEAIFREGLQKMSRHHVHLSATTDTARQVGGRHGKPVILEVRAQEMAEAGFQFFETDNHVWLVDSVPTQYFQRTQP